MTFEGWREARDAGRGAEESELAAAELERQIARAGFAELAEKAVRELFETSLPRTPLYESVPTNTGRRQLTRKHLGDAWVIPVRGDYGFAAMYLLPDGRLFRGTADVWHVRTLFGTWKPRGDWMSTAEDGEARDVTAAELREAVWHVLTSGRD